MALRNTRSPPERREKRILWPATEVLLQLLTLVRKQRGSRWQRRCGRAAQEVDLRHRDAIQESRRAGCERGRRRARAAPDKSSGNGGTAGDLLRRTSKRCWRRVTLPQGDRSPR